MFTTIMYVSAAGLLLISYTKSKENTRKALKKAWKAFENILPQFLSVLLIVGLALSILNAEIISSVIGENSGWLGFILLGVIGSITLIPGFIAFPLAASLLNSGASYMHMAAFISTLMMVGVVTLPVEIRFFGKKATFVRNGLALVFAYGIALVMGVLLG